MQSVLLVIHLIVTLALIILVMLQRSEGGGLGIGGGSGGLGALAGAHTTANVLTRTTAILATIFFISNLSLAYLAKIQTSAESVIEKVQIETPVAPPTDSLEKGSAKGSVKDDKPSVPVVPIVE